MARAGSSSGDAAAGERAGGAGRSEPWELSLEEVLKAYEQPINEEQAWAVCFQCCRGLRGAPGGRRRIRDTADILLRRDGSVSARRESGAAGEAGDGVAAGRGAAPAAGRGCDPPSLPLPDLASDPAPPLPRLLSAGPADLSHFRAPSAALGALLWLLSLPDWKAFLPLSLFWVGSPPNSPLKLGPLPLGSPATHTHTPGTHLTIRASAGWRGEELWLLGPGRSSGRPDSAFPARSPHPVCFLLLWESVPPSDWWCGSLLDWYLGKKGNVLLGLFFVGLPI